MDFVVYLLRCMRPGAHHSLFRWRESEKREGILQKQIWMSELPHTFSQRVIRVGSVREIGISSREDNTAPGLSAVQKGWWGMDEVKREIVVSD